MSYYRFYFLFFVFLNLFCSELFAQTNITSNEKVKDLTQQACDYLDNTNYEKSLEKSGIALKHAFNIKNDTLISRNYNIIGINFHELGEVDKADFLPKSFVLR